MRLPIPLTPRPRLSRRPTLLLPPFTAATFKALDLHYFKPDEIKRARAAPTVEKTIWQVLVKRLRVWIPDSVSAAAVRDARARLAAGDPSAPKEVAVTPTRPYVIAVASI
jgi:hypothetical protein